MGLGSFSGTSRRDSGTSTISSYMGSSANSASPYRFSGQFSRRSSDNSHQSSDASRVSSRTSNSPYEYDISLPGLDSPRDSIVSSHIGNMTMQLERTQLGSNPNLMSPGSAGQQPSPCGQMQRQERGVRCRKDSDSWSVGTPGVLPEGHSQRVRRASDPVPYLDQGDAPVLKRLQCGGSLNSVKPVAMPPAMRSFRSQTGSNANFASSRSSIATDITVATESDLESELISESINLDATADEDAIIDRMLDDNDDMLIPDEMRDYLNEAGRMSPQADSTVPDRSPARHPAKQYAAQNTQMVGAVPPNMQMPSNNYARQMAARQQQQQQQQQQQYGCVSQNAAAMLSPTMMATQQWAMGGTPAAMSPVAAMPCNNCQHSCNGHVTQQQQQQMMQQQQQQMMQQQHQMMQQQQLLPNGGMAPEGYGYGQMANGMVNSQQLMPPPQQAPQGAMQQCTGPWQPVMQQQMANGTHSGIMNMPPTHPQYQQQQCFIQQRMNDHVHTARCHHRSDLGGAPCGGCERGSPMVQVPQISQSQIPHRPGAAPGSQSDRQLGSNVPAQQPFNQMHYGAVYASQPSFIAPHPPSEQRPSRPSSQHRNRGKAAVTRQQMTAYPSGYNPQCHQHQQLSPNCNDVSSTTDVKMCGCRNYGYLGGANNPDLNAISTDDLIDNLSSSSMENLAVSAVVSPTALLNRSASQSSSRLVTPFADAKSRAASSHALNTSNMVVNHMSSVLTQLAEENKYLNNC